MNVLDPGFQSKLMVPTKMSFNLEGYNVILAR